jgi:hypothetical protein
MAVGLALFALGWLTGRIARRRAVRPAGQPDPVCLCGHHYGTHDPGTGACVAVEVVTMHSSRKGTYQADHPCPCLRYTGPQPIEQFWVPPVADAALVTAPRPLPEMKP